MRASFSQIICEALTHCSHGIANPGNFYHFGKPFSEKRLDKLGRQAVLTKGVFVVKKSHLVSR